MQVRRSWRPSARHPSCQRASRTAYQLSEKQQKLQVSCDNESAQITNQYIIGRGAELYDHRLSGAGDRRTVMRRFSVRRYGSIHWTIVHLPRRIQQKLIDALDRGDVRAHPGSAWQMRRNLTVALHPLQRSGKGDASLKTAWRMSIFRWARCSHLRMLAGTNGHAACDRRYI